jgi:uncharacterized RDD family membrane protein YckC
MAEVAQIQPPAARSEYAGFWRRFLAVCIDLLLSTPVYYGVKALAGQQGFFSSRWQASPGMYVLRFRITDAHGARIGFGRGLYWMATSLVMWLICFAGVAYLQSQFDLYGIAQLRLSCLQQNIAEEECRNIIQESANNISYTAFMLLVYASLGLFVFLTFIWALSIALSRDKTGFHNVMCGTRFFKGRP